jgi:hypothetical protein
MRSRIAAASPELVAAAIGGFSVGPMLLLVSGHFSAVLGVPLGLVGAAVACWLCGIPEELGSRRDLLWTAAAALIAIAWFALNVHYAAQDVYATRDPATYTITGQWLTNHSSLEIHTHPEVFGTPAGGKIASGAFPVVGPGVLNAQGDHLLPVFLGLSGRLFGTTALLATNTALAALALFVFFGVARRVAGPAWGLLAMAALAVSMPILYVGRDSYTEPLTMLFLMGALVFLHRAYTTGRWQDWALAGLVGGASTGVRVDSYGALIGVVAAGAVMVAVADPSGRRTALTRAGALLAGAAIPITLGWIDLTHLSQQYYDSQHSNITHLIAALVLVTLAAPLVVWLLWRSGVREWLGRERTARRLTVGINTTLVVVFLGLASRPLWQKTRGPLRTNLESMQARWHKPIDGTRTYNEQTIHWLAQYYGWPTIVLAVGGYALLITALIRRRAYVLSGTLGMGLTMSALYLYNCEVAPDQPWAMRRYVPVILPLLLTAAAVALRFLWQEERRRAWLRPAVVALAVVAVGFPAVVSWPMRAVSEEDGQRQQLDDICTAVGPHGAIVEVDKDSIAGYGQSLRSFCDVPTIGLLDASPAQLAQVGAAARAHGRRLFVLGQTPDHTGGTAGHAFSVVNVERWPTQINQPPDQGDIQQYAVWLSEVDASGVLVPVGALRSGP